MSSNDQNSNNQIAGSIAYPMSNEAVEPLPEQPRQPRNLQGLLRFAMEATRAEDAPGASDVAPMDVERLRFLEEALKALTVDMAAVIKKAIKLLSDSEKISSIRHGDPLPEDVEYEFTNLQELVDDIDVANDFYKLGGFSIFPVCLSCENDSVRAQACSVLGDCCQNNPFCQAKALECGLLNVLLNLVQSETEFTLGKTIYALSCACREYPPACAELVSQGGCGTLTTIIANTDYDMVLTKAAFLVRYLVYNYPDAKQKFIEQNLVGTIAAKIKENRDSTSEHLLSILLGLVEDKNPTVIRQCVDANLKKALENHLKHGDLQDDTFLEEKEYCDQLLQVLEKYPEGNDEEQVDR